MDLNHVLTILVTLRQKRFNDVFHEQRLTAHLCTISSRCKYSTRVWFRASYPLLYAMLLGMFNVSAWSTPNISINHASNDHAVNVVSDVVGH